MVVRNGECPAVVAEDGVEDLPDGEERPVDCAFPDRNRSHEAVRWVADEDDDPLSSGPMQLPDSDPCNILGAAQARAVGRCLQGQLAEAERCGERRGLRRTDPRMTGDLFRSGQGKLGEPTEVRDQGVGELESALTLTASPQKKRQELTIAQGLGAERQESVAGPIAGWEIVEPHDATLSANLSRVPRESVSTALRSETKRVARWPLRENEFVRSTMDYDIDDVRIPPGEVWFFPYLSGLRDRERVGKWELIPVPLLTPDDCLAGPLHGYVTGLARLYERPDGSGAFVRPSEGLIGNRADHADAWLLQRAVGVAAVTWNPALDQDTDETSNLGHTVVTSDSTVLYGHPFSPDGGVTTVRGALVRRRDIGLRVGDDAITIQAPLELPSSLLGGVLDTEYADAVLDVLMNSVELSDAGELAGRLLRAAEWLDVVWRNTESVTTDTRILAVHAALEALIAPRGESSNITTFRQSLGSLLDSDDAEREPRSYLTLKGETKVEAMTTQEWWAHRFRELRNDLAHGVRPADEDYIHEGRHHFAIGEEVLRRVVREKVIGACAGLELLRIEPLQRVLYGWPRRTPPGSAESSA